MKTDVLFSGFPGHSDRGFLGWSSTVLIQTDDHQSMLFDTAGFNERPVLPARLLEHGVACEEISTVFLSHFHFDHVANFVYFKNAHFYLHKKDAEHVQQCDDVHHDPAVPYEMYENLIKTGRLTLIDGEQGEINNLKWMLTPGHTPGLYSVLVPVNGATWVLASDAVKNQNEWETEQVAMTLDAEASRKSIQKIKQIADVVVPGHDSPLIVRRDEQSVSVNRFSDPSIHITCPEGIKTSIKMDFHK